jgi:hypothetical protein
MLKKKSDLEASGKRDSTDYQIEKAKMVGIVGRFAYMKPSHTAEDIARLLHISGLQSEEFRKYGKKKGMRALYTRSEVGGSWWMNFSFYVFAFTPQELERTELARQIFFSKVCVCSQLRGLFSLKI